MKTRENERNAYHGVLNERTKMKKKMRVWFENFFNEGYKNQLWQNQKYLDDERPEAMLFLRIRQGSEVIKETGDHYEILCLK